MKKPLIVHLGKYYPPVKGGMETSLKSLAERLSRLFRVRVLVSNTSPGTVVEKNGELEVIRLARYGVVFSQPMCLSLFRRLKRLREADIIHLHLPNPLAAAAYLACSPKGALVVSYHADISRQRMLAWFYAPLVKAVLSRACRIVVTSPHLIGASPFLPPFREKCSVIPHGVEPGWFTPDNAVRERAATIKDSCPKPIILFVGRLVYYKGLDCLLTAMRSVDGQLIIVGGGAMAARLKRRARLLGVDGKVTWAGEVDDSVLPAYYLACELFVLPSNRSSESFSIAMLEAQASGKPVVSTALPTGVTFVNRDKETGLTVPVGDSAALAGAINHLLCDGGLRAAYGANAKKRAEAEFSADMMAERFISLYASMLNSEL